MIVFPCNSCGRTLQVDEAHAGKAVRCPQCLKAVKAPIRTVQTPVGAAVGSSQPAPPPQRRIATPNPWQPRSSSKATYGFPCPYCSSRLEGSAGLGGQENQCPTCGNLIVVPILDRYNRLIDPVTREIVRQDPHPVHTYAAAGDRAPKIIRRDDGTQIIQCSRCGAESPITANNCKSCGMPFTMEGTTFDAAGSSDGYCVAALVLGVVGLVTFFILIPPILAIAFGIAGLYRISKGAESRGGRGMAIGGICLGVLGVVFWLGHQGFF